MRKTGCGNLLYIFGLFGVYIIRRQNKGEMMTRRRMK